jgi:Domain of unknown function (DUF5911)
MPRVDSASVFARVLGHSRGRYGTLAPSEADARIHRRYLDVTLVLETTFRTSSAEAKVLDCFVIPRRRQDGPPSPPELAEIHNQQFANVLCETVIMHLVAILAPGGTL